MKKKNSNYCKVAGVRVDLIAKSLLFRNLECSFNLGSTELDLNVVHTLNPEICVQAMRRPEYASILNSGSYNVVDGIGLLWAVCRSIGRDVGRCCGSDMIYDLAAMCQRYDRALMLIGGTPRRLDKACANLSSRFPGLKVVGHSPAFSHTLPLPTQDEIEKLICAHKPAVLAVCLGAPKQELWIQQNKKFLSNHGVCVATGLGGTIDFLSGEIPRAPVLIRKMGMEWFYRLYKQPWRWKRQFDTLPLFALNVLFKRNFVALD